MASSQPILLEQKLAQLQADNIIYQDEIQRLRKRVLSLEEYRIKYELLLEQQKEESPLHRSRRVDEINNMNKKIEENNDKWNLKIKLLESKYEQSLHQLEQRNIDLVAELESVGKVSSARQKDTGMKAIDLAGLIELRDEVAQLKFKNAQLSQELTAIKQSKELTQNKQAQNIELLLEQARSEEKQFYRQAIMDLEQQVADLNNEVEFHKVRASPERQQEIARLLNEIKKIEAEHDKQTQKFNELIKNQKEEMKILENTFQISKKQSLDHNQILADQLSQLQQKYLESESAHHSELMACRLEMELLRQKQVDLLKQSFEKMENSHDSERQQWQLIVKEQQQETERIKQMWDEEKEKFSDEKNKLKAKINQMKMRQKRTAEQEKSLTDNETYKLISSLRQIDEEENKYNDYESNVTFLSRQLKRATKKIEEKQRECAKLMNELKVQREEFETETEFIKKVERQQMLFYKEKLVEADLQNSKLLEELRQKDNHMRVAHTQNRIEQEKLMVETQQLNQILREMERDYSRLTDNKKNLFQEYRSERDMVFTGKVELNQERKDKWLQLDRQKNELEIAYKEREKQMKIHYELKIQELTQKLSKVNQMKELAAAENNILKERVNSEGGRFGTKSEVEQNSKDLHKKLATLDLEISLTQNLFSTIKSVRNRTQKLKTTSELQEMSEDESMISSVTSKEQKIMNLQNESLDQEELERENVAPTFSGIRADEAERGEREMNYENFSFKPHEPTIKITNVNKRNVSDVSFNNESKNDGDKTPGWGGF